MNMHVRREHVMRLAGRLFLLEREQILGKENLVFFLHICKKTTHVVIKQESSSKSLEATHIGMVEKLVWQFLE
jgi:hypothetical protein